MNVYQILYAVIGLLSLSSCTSTFCIGTYDYLQTNAEALMSGVSGFLEVFPWGWIVQFSNETFNTAEGGFNPWPSFNISFTYFYTLVICIVLHRDARRLGLTTLMAVCVLVGTYFCLSMTFPIYLIKRSQKLAELKDKEDEAPLDYGKSGQAILVCQALTVAGLAALCYFGAAGGDSTVYGLVFGTVGIVLPLSYAACVFVGGAEPAEAMSKSLLTSYLAACAVVALGGYGMVAYSGSPPTYSVDSLKTWFTDVFLFDSWAIRLSGVVIIAEGGNIMLALVELFFAPFGFLAFAYGRLQAAKARESCDYTAMIE